MQYLKTNIGEPHSVPAIPPSGRNRAKPKSASLTISSDGIGFGNTGCGLHKRIFCGLKKPLLIQDGFIINT